jgi:hypothetical protein
VTVRGRFRLPKNFQHSVSGVGPPSLWRLGKPAELPVTIAEP